MADNNPTINTRATEGGPHKFDIGAGPVTVQNRGAGLGADVYVSRSPDVSTDGPGIELATNERIRLRVINAPIYMTSDTDGADVRIERF